MTLHIEHFKKKLTEERDLIERELRSVGRVNPDNTNDWEPTAGSLNIDPAEEEERAGAATDFEDRSAIEFELEKRLITKELAACGIQSVYTSPQNLSVNTINKYLELKARGLV